MYIHDKGTNRRTMIVGLAFCVAFVVASFWARPQAGHVLGKSDRLMLTKTAKLVDGQSR